MKRDRGYRAGIAARVVGALFGGYGLAAALAMALARVLPGAAAEAVVWGTLAGVLVMPAAIIWMFGARSARRAWGGLVLAIATAALCAWLAGGAA